jgi:hypothetical protein
VKPAWLQGLIVILTLECDVLIDETCQPENSRLSRPIDLRES